MFMQEYDQVINKTKIQNGKIYDSLMHIPSLTT